VTVVQLLDSDRGEVVEVAIELLIHGGARLGIATFVNLVQRRVLTRSASASALGPAPTISVR